MKRLLFTLGCLTALMGCTSSAKYDIDVTCTSAMMLPITTDNSGMEEFACGARFDIHCVGNTVQQMRNNSSNVFLCTTVDKKSVRITITD